MDARREMYRRRILDAAEREFSRTGYADTKMQAIAKAADLSLATVYKSFAGKHEIWDELHAARIEALLARVESAGQSSVVESMVSGVATTARYLMEQEHFLDLSIRAGAGWASNPEGGRGAQRTVWGAGLDMIVGAIETAAAQGEVREVRPRVAAGLVVSALQVWLTDWVSSGRDRPADEVVDELSSHVRLVLTGAT